MSAFGGKAYIARTLPNVRPKADIGRPISRRSISRGKGLRLKRSSRTMTPLVEVHSSKERCDDRQTYNNVRAARWHDNLHHWFSPSTGSVCHARQERGVSPR